MSDVFCTHFAIFPPYTSTGPKIDALLRCRLRWPWTVQHAHPSDNPGRVHFCPRRTTTELGWSVLNHCSVCTTILVLLYLWHGTVCLNHGWTMAKSCRSACMWAGQCVLCLLQNLFKQSKLSLTLTLARGKCWGSCSDYNWDSWAPHIALHASRNVAWHLKCL